MGTMLAFIALVAVSSHLAPRVPRRDIFFGVTVARGFWDEPVARRVSRQYAREIWLLAFIAAALVITSPMPLVSGPMLLGQTIGAIVAFARARRAVLPHAVAPDTSRQAELAPRPSLPGGTIGQLGPFLILLAAAAYVGLHWEDVPARFPTHWNLAGRPDDWTAKSVGGVFRGLALGLFACTLMCLMSYAVLHQARLPRVTGAEGDQHRRVRRVNLVATLASEYLIALLVSWTTVVSMFASDAGQQRLPLAFRIAPFALLIGGIVAVMWIRSGAAVSGGRPIGDTTPDSAWILGQFYVNRTDPALLVEKRMGLGYTLNLGNPLSWLIVVVIIGVVSGLLLMA